MRDDHHSGDGPAAQEKQHFPEPLSRNHLPPAQTGCCVFCWRIRRAFVDKDKAKQTARTDHRTADSSDNFECALNTEVRCQRMRDWGKNDRTQSVKGRGHTARKTSPVGEQFHACVDCGAVRQSEAKTEQQ